MRRTGLLIVAVTGSILGSGCRTCDDRCGVFGRSETPSRLPREPDCCPAVPTARGQVPGLPTGAQGWPADPGYGYPTIPVYPGGGTTVGPPPGGLPPPNELPYPTIPSPRVPEGPQAQPTPAIPFGGTLSPPAARTTGEAKAGK
jgi:hypothetical protein